MACEVAMEFTTSVSMGCLFNFSPEAEKRPFPPPHPRQLRLYYCMNLEYIAIWVQLVNSLSTGTFIEKPAMQTTCMELSITGLQGSYVELVVTLGWQVIQIPFCILTSSK